jgi:hypothetical protein
MRSRLEAATRPCGGGGASIPTSRSPSRRVRLPAITEGNETARGVTLERRERNRRLEAGERAGWSFGDACQRREMVRRVRDDGEALLTGVDAVLTRVNVPLDRTPRPRDSSVTTRGRPSMSSFMHRNRTANSQIHLRRRSPISSR